MRAADDEDSDAKGQDSDANDQDGGPVRKKVKTLKNEKIVKPVAPVSQRNYKRQNLQGVMPEKRKRALPREVPLPPVASPFSLHGQLPTHLLLDLIAFTIRIIHSHSHACTHHG